MTTNTEPTTTPHVPAWLNLDGFCPPEIRKQIAMAADALEVFLADGDFEGHCRQAWEAVAAYEKATAYDLDHQSEFLNELTGFYRLTDATAKLSDLARIAHGEGPNALKAPSWYVPWGDRTEGVQS